MKTCYFKTAHLPHWYRRAKEQMERSSSSGKGQTALTLNSYIILNIMIQASKINNSMPLWTQTAVHSGYFPAVQIFCPVSPETQRLWAELKLFYKHS